MMVHHATAARAAVWRRSPGRRRCSRARSAELPAGEIAALIDLAHQGEEIAITIIREAGEHLGVAVASLVNMINPGCVVIGGSLATTGDLLLGPLRATLRRRGLAIAADHVSILPGALGAEVVAIGAATIVIQDAFSAPSLVPMTASAAQGIISESMPLKEQLKGGGS
jgi:predicted NBD/HSP70 family sugar kinase